MHDREGADHVDNDVVTRGGVGVEEDAVQHRWPGEFDPRLFAQFASQRLLGRLPPPLSGRFASRPLLGRFPDLHSATRKMPATDVSVSDEKDATVFIDDCSSHADRESMEEAAIDRVQARDQAFGICHGSLSTPAKKMNPSGIMALERIRPWRGTGLKRRGRGCRA